MLKTIKFLNFLLSENMIATSSQGLLFMRICWCINNQSWCIPKPITHTTETLPAYFYAAP